MADRYWVGGTATWDGTAGSKWATTSGGAGGASVPTTNDDVYFDQNSNSGTNAFTVTVSSTRSCRNLTVQNLDGAMTLTNGTINASGNVIIQDLNTSSLTIISTTISVTGNFTAQNLSASLIFSGFRNISVSGNLTLPSTGVITTDWTGFLTVATSNSPTNVTINTGGVLIPNMDLGVRNSTPGTTSTKTVTLASSLNVKDQFRVCANLSTQGFTIQAPTINIFDYVMVLDFSNSHIITSRVSNGFFNTTTNGYSLYVSIITNNTDITFFTPNTTSDKTELFALDLVPLNLNFKNVTITTESGAFAVAGFKSSFTAENFIIPEISTNTLYVSFTGDCTVSNTIDIQSTTDVNSKRRVVLKSSFENEESFSWNLGGTNLYATNADFYGIKTTASTVNCNRCGDLGFNEGIVFDNPRTLYWTGESTDVWVDSKWSLVENEEGTELYPLAQDDVILDDFSSSEVVLDRSVSVKNLTIDRTSPITLSDTRPSFIDNNPGDILDFMIKITGNLTFPDDDTLVLLPITGQIKFYGPGIKNIRAAYLKFVLIDTYLGTVRIQNDIEIDRLAISSGTFDSNSYDIKTQRIDSWPIFPSSDRVSSSLIGNPIYNAVVRIGTVWYSFFDNYKVTKNINFVNSIIECNSMDFPVTGPKKQQFPTNGESHPYIPPTEINFTDSTLIVTGTGSIKLNEWFQSGSSTGTPPHQKIQEFHLNKVIIANSSSSCILENFSSINNLQVDRTGPFTLSFGNFFTEREPLNISSWGVSGTSGELITLSTASKINKVGGGIVEADYLSISNSTVQPIDTWYAGPNSLNDGNNVNWVFTNPLNSSSSGDFFILFG
jgi:hypothetical protein